MSLDLSSITLPFSATDLLGTAMSLVTLLGPFILLGVALSFAPRIVSFFKNGLSARK